MRASAVKSMLWNETSAVVDRSLRPTESRAPFCAHWAPIWTPSGPLPTGKEKPIPPAMPVYWDASKVAGPLLANVMFAAFTPTSGKSRVRSRPLLLSAGWTAGAGMGAPGAAAGARDCAAAPSARICA